MSRTICGWLQQRGDERDADSPDLRVSWTTDDESDQLFFTLDASFIHTAWRIPDLSVEDVTSLRDLLTRTLRTVDSEDA